MRDSDFERVSGRLNSLDAIGPLCRIAEATARTLQLPYAYIVARREDAIIPLATWGGSLWKSQMPLPSRRIANRLRETVVVQNLLQDKDFHSYEIVDEPIGARFLASTPLPFHGLPFPVTLTAIGCEPRNNIGLVTSVLEGNATFAADYIKMLLETVNLTDQLADARSSSVTTLITVEPASVTSEFLTKTLIRQRRIRERKGVTFLATATWRSTVREEQLSALKVLKKHLPQDFVESVAVDLAASLQAVTGGQAFKYVTWVPCGHSGVGCLAEKSAQALAKIIDAEAVQAFKPLQSCGTSHPRKSARLPPMRLMREFDAPVVLVDDVVTTGTHMQRASALLQSAAPAVFSIAWITR